MEVNGPPPPGRVPHGAGGAEEQREPQGAHWCDTDNTSDDSEGVAADNVKTGVSV